MSAAKSVDVLPKETSALFSTTVVGSGSPNQRLRALSGSPARPLLGADVLPNLKSMQHSVHNNLLNTKQQYHVAFRDQFTDSASPIKRLSTASAVAGPAYFSQVTLPPPNSTTLIPSEKTFSNDDAYKMHTNAVSAYTTQHSVDVSDAGFGSSIFTPFLQAGNAVVQLQRSIELYEAKLKKARRRLEEEQVEREKALNAYLRYAVNAGSADERAKRKDEFQRRNSKYSSNILHLERKVIEYKAKIDQLSTQLATSKGSTGSSSDSQPNAAAVSSSTDSDMYETLQSNQSQAQQQHQNNKWKSATLPPGYAAPSSKLLKSLGGAGSVIRKAVGGAPNATAQQPLPRSGAQIHSASTVNLTRLETSPLQQQQQHEQLQLNIPFQPTKRVSNTSTTTLESGDSAETQNAALLNESTNSKLRYGKMALSLRDSVSSTNNNSTNAHVGGFSSMRGKSKDDSALTNFGANKINQRVLQSGGSTVDTTTTRKSGNSRWYHTHGLGESSAKDQNFTDINQPGLLDDEQVSVSSVGTGSRGASGGDTSTSDYALRQRFDQLIHEMSDIRTQLGNWNESIEVLRENSDSQFAKLSQALEENLWKSRAVETQLADVVELRRADVDSWRHAVEEMEERISYQIQERLRDMQEYVDRLDTRFALMEHTQAREKALLSLESIQNSTTQQMLFKLLNVVLAVLQFAIVLGSSVAAMIAPIFDSKLSFFAATLVVAVAFVVANSVDSMSDLLNPIKFGRSFLDFMLNYGSPATEQKLRQDAALKS